LLGPGDELLIRAWGKIDLDERVAVDRSGQIYIPKVGSVNVAGLHYEQLNGYLHSAIGRYFKDFDLNVSMGQLRSIQVFVLGYARRPGTYTVSSLSTLMNALFASGGPASNGSMRHVQLKRANKVVTDLDIYDLVLRGDKSADASLQSGDVIYIPHVGPELALVGSVNAPAIYELRKTTELGQAVEDAGGLTSIAETKRVGLDRIGGSGRSFEEFSLDADGLKHTLQDGDIVRIFPVSPRVGNAVTLRGNVAQPGRYTWHEGMKVTDLVPTRESLITRDYWNAINELGGNEGEDEFLPRARRGRTQREEATTSDNPQAGEYAIGGASDNNSPGGQQQPEENLRTEIKHRGEINWQYAVIERMNQKDLTTQLISFNLGEAIDHPASLENRGLVAGDVVTIFSQDDVPVGMDTRATFVQIEGEVMAPGVYRVARGETLRDVVRRAGGLTRHAYLYASELNRESTRKEQEARLAQMVRQMQRDLAQAAANTTSVTPEDEADDRARLQGQRETVARLAQTKPTGRVVLNLPPDASTVDDIPEMPLEDGDTFLVPAREDTVQVLGAVYNENAFRYVPRKSVTQYLENAGGATRQADKDRAFVIRADGTVVSRQQHHSAISGNPFDRMKLMPGDAIVVPVRFKTGSILRGLRDWSVVFGQFALGAAAISVIK
jgi:protein involved in polysaccharide export with SLBB domain